MVHLSETWSKLTRWYKYENVFSQTVFIAAMTKEVEGWRAGFIYLWEMYH